ncbi:uncharacterized protein LOC135682357 isoform X2 [Rhopilema esculentum]|uniref:uncharacterized protein LOC135682357 isoform X2 n=1 Tax=Rhopilema esculentum TaxID=499914 RepID=UPI0031D31F9F
MSCQDTNVVHGKVLVKKERQNPSGIVSVPLNGNGSLPGNAFLARPGIGNSRKAGKLGGGTDRALSAGTFARNQQLENVMNQSVEVPKGWNRVIEKGDIVYISPNRSRLKSVADVIAYLIAPATCKCGLVCPFKLEEMFNFNPNVISRPLLQKPAQSMGACDSCKVNEGFEAILPQFSPEKIMRMLRKGSKKKKKKSKNSEKEGKKKNRHNKTGQGNDQFAAQSIQTWVNSGIPGTSTASKQASVSGPIPSLTGTVKMVAGIDNKTRYYPDHSDYIGSIEPNDTAVISENKAQILLSNTVHQNRKQKRSSPAIVRPALSSPAITDDKSMSSKTSGKKSSSKQKRIPKTKEDLNIASMMGRVKQQVGEIDKIRTSQMFTSATQGLPKQTAASTFNETVKSSTVELSEMKPGQQNITNNLPTSSGVLNLIRAQAPPNITLPASHSNMLPPGLAQGMRATISSTEPGKIQHPSSIKNVHAALTEAQQHNWTQDPRLFAGKATSNVYWGSKEHSSLNDMLSSSVESSLPQRTETQKNDTGGNGGLLHSLKEVANTLANDPNRVRVAVENIPSSELLTEQAEKEKMLLAALNSLKDQRVIRGNSEYLGDRPETILSKSKAPSLSNKSSQQAKEQALSSDVIRQYPSQLKAQDVGSAHVNLQTLTNANSPVTSQLMKQSLSALKDSAASNETQVNNKDSKLAASLSESHSSTASSSENLTKSSPMVVFQVVSQSSSSKSATATGMISTASLSTSVSTTPAQQVNYQGFYGIPNTASVPRQPSAAYQNSVAANNPAQFLIMGSQASQALQHLALQQSNALQVSLQRAESPHPMYLQTLSGYAPNALKTSHPNIGFAYASVPIQFMTIGGTQVVGKQPQATAANVERYQNLYQYYQGVRPAEAAKTDSNKHVTSQTTTLMYPGVNPYGQTPNNYVRIAPAHVANRIPLPPTPDVKPLAGLEALKGEQQLSEMLSVSQAIAKQGIFPGSAVATSLPVKVERTQKSSALSPLSEKKDLLSIDVKTEINLQPEVIEKPHIASQVSEEQKPLVTDLSPGLSDVGSVRATASRDSSIGSSGMSSAPSQLVCTGEENGPKSVPLGVGLASVSNSSTNSNSYIARQGTSAVITESLVVSNERQDITQDCAKVVVKHEEPDEISLQCNENCNTRSGDSRTPTPELKNKVEFSNGANLRMEACIPAQDISGNLKIGDLIWGHQKGYSAWPGKIVSELEVKEICAEPGKVWVKWYGEHTHSQMESASLKSLQEGLMEYRNSCRRRKNSAKKTAESLELAITEALREANFSPTTVKILQFDSEEGVSEAKKPKR